LFGEQEWKARARVGSKRFFLLHAVAVAQNCSYALYSCSILFYGAGGDESW